MDEGGKKKRAWKVESRRGRTDCGGEETDLEVEGSQNSRKTGKEAN